MAALLTATPTPSERERSAARSREAILDAAERLFAERGYQATSLTEVGNLSGLSRATPGYFFGSKAELYRAVLDRVFAEARDAVQRGRERSKASDEPPEAVLGAVIRDYFDFLARRPAFVRLMEREALGDGPDPDDRSLSRSAGREALEALMAEVGYQGETGEDAAHLLVSLLALCWFPLVHGKTMLPAVGLDAGSPGFGEARKRHIVDLILHGVAGRLAADRRGDRK